MDSFAEHFPGSSFYRQAARYDRASTVREPVVDRYGFGYAERHLQCTWHDPRWRPGTLVTSTGESVVVEDPGRWNLEAGPDFLDAALLVGGDERRVSGDIEVHVTPEDWRRHKHSNDPRYSQVMAHVTYFPGPPPDAGIAGGLLAISLKNALDRDPCFSFENIDITAYPFAERMPRPACSVALAALGPDFSAQVLESAGEERLRIKADRIASAIATKGEAQAFYEETMCALGYKNNRVPFRQLAARLPVQVLREESGGDNVTAMALLLGLSGLMPVKSRDSWDPETRSYVRALWDAWWKRRSRFDAMVMSAGEWSLSGVRPQNHPVRRIAAAVSLFTGTNRLPASLANTSGPGDRDWIRSAVDQLTGAATPGYWRRRFSFSHRVAGGNVALLGRRRAAAILVNVVVPFMVAAGRMPAPATELLRLLPPGTAGEPVRRAAFLLFGRDHNPRFHQCALRQQGLIQVFNDFCITDRSGCRDCAFAAALENAAADKP